MKLLDTELVALDGKCRPEIQKRVDDAKSRIADVPGAGGCDPKVADLARAVVAYAKKMGKLWWQSVRITRCNICNRSDGYYEHQRNSKYKRKGQPDYDRPKYFMGIDIKDRIVCIKDHISLGGCVACVEAAKPLVVGALKDQAFELPEALTGEKPRFKNWGKVKCRCGWEGHKGEMLELLTLMGDGKYRGGCPKCKAENSLFDTPVKTVDGWVCVPVS